MKLIIDEQFENERIDSYLAKITPNKSRSKIQAEIKKGLVLVNKKTVKPSYLLKENDDIEISEEFCKEEDCIPKAEKIDIEVVWEDDNMAIINKPSGMLTHPTVNEMSGTLVNALLNKYGENLSDINGEMRRGIVHRLDRNTSGLIMVAKNNKTHEFLVNEMKEKRFSKKYLAIVRGIVEEDSFEISTPIGRHLTQPHKQCVRTDGKESLTIVNVLERFDNATFIELTLVTGRTHQIRVHLSSIGHPVFNDSLYGFGKAKIKTDEQVLQSYKLEFTKPFTNERIEITIPYDNDLERVLAYLKS